MLKKGMYILSLISMLLFMTLLLILNVVPNKYLIIIGIILAIVYLILGIVTFKIKSKVLSIVFMIIEAILGMTFIWAGYSVYKTNDFINNINDNNEVALYYVVVLKDSNYEKLNDIDQKKMGLYSINDKNYELALNNISKKISYDSTEYNEFIVVANSLLNKKVDAILISDFNKEMLDEEIASFKDKTKIIHTEKIEISSNSNEKNVKINQDTFSILISGIDTYGSINKVSRSDVNIVVTINPNTNEILLTSIPRDYYVQLHGTSGVKDKLTHAGIYGIDMSVNTIGDLLNTNIDYYLRVNFDTLVSVVDQIGGIDVYSDTSFRAYNGDEFVEGLNHLDGSRALAYSRERKQFAEGDRKRGEHQEQVITAIIDKVSTSTVLLNNYTGILESLSNSFQTSVPSYTIKAFVKNQLDEMPSWNIKSISLDGYGSMNYTYSMPSSLLYVMIPNQTTVDIAKRAISGMEQNKTLAELGL